MTEVSDMPICEFDDGWEPCHSLIDDAAGVLSDPDRWPDHPFCEGVARSSTKRWAMDRLKGIFGTSGIPPGLQAWSEEWPIRVGPFPGDVPSGLLPLRNGAKAALIFPIDVPFVRITAFGIVDTHPEATLLIDGKEEFPTSTMQFVVAGWNSKAANKLTANASRWWDGLQSTGRPKGIFPSFQDLLVAYAELHRKGRGRRIREHDVANYFNKSDRHIRSAMNMRWPEFLLEAQSYLDELEQRRISRKAWQDRMSKKRK